MRNWPVRASHFRGRRRKDGGAGSNEVPSCVVPSSGCRRQARSTRVLLWDFAECGEERFAVHFYLAEPVWRPAGGPTFHRQPLRARNPMS